MPRPDTPLTLFLRPGKPDFMNNRTPSPEHTHERSFNTAPELTPELMSDIERCVEAALEEDIKTGDITAGLIRHDQQASAQVITREPAVICGQAWVDAVFNKLDPAVQIQWFVNEGESVEANTPLFALNGNARSIVTGERTALNFLQLLSGTATICQHYANIVKASPVKLLDTRKTIPGLRLAQKYAVRCGGCHNHRTGLYDAFLIKENHIAACHGIASAIKTARQQQPDKTIEVEVETLTELSQALEAGADIIMLDNFSLEDMRKAANLVQGKARLEASGNVTKERLPEIASTGVDYISIGALTKDCKAIDLSMRLELLDQQGQPLRR